jgi:uncharacterized protein (UPF0335 family)
VTDNATIDVLGGNAQTQLKSIVERVERLREDAKVISDDLKGVYAEARGNGFDVKVIKLIVKRRSEDAAKRVETEAILDLYLSALGEVA